MIVQGNAVGEVRGQVYAYPLIDDSTDTLVGFKVLCPAPWEIAGSIPGTGITFSFTAAEIAALGGEIALPEPLSKVQLYDGEPDSMAFPEVEWRARRR